MAADQNAIASRDEADIRNLVNQLAAAWNAGDGKSYGRAFTSNCDYVTFNGERVRGGDAVAASHQALFDTHLKGSKLIFENVDWRALGADIVVVHGTGAILLEGQKEVQPSRRSIQTLVAVREDREWKFAAFHNTRIFKITAFRAILMKFGL